MPIKPISPDEVVIQKIKDIPDEVIDCWNKAIAENWRGTSYAIIYQNAIVDKLASVMNVEHGLIFKNGWLDIENIYGENGWKVEYDKPGYNESYEAFFKFSKK